MPPALELRTRAEASMVEPQSVTVNGYDLAQYVWGDVYDERFPALAPPSVVALDARHNAIENLHGLEFFPLLAALNVGGNCLRSLRCQACPPPTTERSKEVGWGHCPAGAKTAVTDLGPVPAGSTDSHVPGHILQQAH